MKFSAGCVNNCEVESWPFKANVSFHSDVDFGLALTSMLSNVTFLRTCRNCAAKYTSMRCRMGSSRFGWRMREAQAKSHTCAG